MVPTPGSEWALALALIGLYFTVLLSLPTRWTWARAVTIGGALAIAARYLHWRLVETVLPVDFRTIRGAWIWTVFLVEVVAILNSAITYLMLTRTSDHTPEADAGERRLRRMPPESLPRVDVFLCTYNEGLEVLEGPIAAAKGMDYPNFTVWVLDDGRRPWLRDYCAEQGVAYLTRPDNTHAKAGNINHALARTDGELFAILDADFAPRRDFLMRTVGFFEDPRIAIVQTPHHFLNTDLYEMNLGLGEHAPNEQRLFFDTIQVSRDAWGCSFCCGSASVQRRSALLEIGGIPTESVTEDILSSLMLLRRGYVTRFLDEPLAFGLSPESVKGMFVQRQRWCRGGLQLLFLRDGVLGPGLTWLQRLFFFPSDWLVQTPVRLFAVLVPLLYLWTGIPPLENAGLADLVRYQVPMLIALTAPMVWLSRGRYLPFVSTGFSLFLSFRLVPTILSTLIRPFGTPFRVTPKGAGAGRGVDHFARGCASALLALTMLGLFINGVPGLQVIADPEHRAAATFFSMLNIGCLVLAILASRDKDRSRAKERMRTSATVICECPDGRRLRASLIDISSAGAGIVWPAGVPIPRAVKLLVPGRRVIRADIVREDGDHLGLRFDFVDPADRQAILSWAYSIGPSRRPTELSTLELGRRLLARCLG